MYEEKTLAAITDHPYSTQIGMRFVQNLFPGIREADAESMFWNIVVSGDTKYLDQIYLPYQVAEIKELLNSHRQLGGWLWNHENIYPLANFYKVEADAIRSGRYPNPYTTSPDPVLKAQWDQRMAEAQAEVNEGTRVQNMALVQQGLDKFVQLTWNPPAGQVPIARIPRIGEAEPEKVPSRMLRFIDVYGKVFKAVWGVAAAIVTLGIAKEFVAKYISKSPAMETALEKANKAREALGKKPLEQAVVDNQVVKFVSEIANQQIGDMTNEQVANVAVASASAQQDRDAQADEQKTGAEPAPAPTRVEPVITPAKAAINPLMLGALGVLTLGIILTPTKKVRR